MYRLTTMQQVLRTRARRNDRSVVSLKTKAYGEQREKESGETGGSHDQHKSAQHQRHEREKLELVRQQQWQHELLQLLEVLYLKRLVFFAFLFPPAFFLHDRRFLVAIICTEGKNKYKSKINILYVFVLRGLVTVYILVDLNLKARQNYRI